MVVDADLVELRCVDAVQAIGDVTELDGGAVPDHDGRGTGGSQRQNEKADQGRPNREKQVSSSHASYYRGRECVSNITECHKNPCLARALRMDVPDFSRLYSAPDLILSSIPSQ